MKDIEKTKEEINKLVREIKSVFVNGSLELADAVSEITLENENIDKFINNCIVKGMELQHNSNTSLFEKKENNSQLPKSDAICNVQVADVGKGALSSADTHKGKNIRNKWGRTYAN